jgi:8-oxo-dGTP pyrophosphatase MutT (NUDIX family)
MTKEKSCGALVFYKNGECIEILILKHRLGGHWSFPKGHVERNETERQTARREVFEETGIKITILEKFREMVSYSPKPGVDKDVVYFIASAVDKVTRMQIEEVSEIKWVELSAAHEFLTYYNDKQLLKSAKKYISEHGL